MLYFSEQRNKERNVISKRMTDLLDIQMLLVLAGCKWSGGAELDDLNVSDKELERLISQQDIRTFAESLLKQLQEMAEVSRKESKGESNTNPTLLASPWSWQRRRQRQSPRLTRPGT